MTTSVARWGNSQGVRIPRHILEMSGIAQDDVVDITVENGVILIKKTSRRKNIQELFDGYTGEYSPEEPDWGAPAGNEIW